jgi:hypothetical protein
VEGIDKFGCGLLGSKARRDEYELWLAKQPVCGACGNLLSVCEIGSCPWGLVEKPIWSEERQDYFTAAQLYHPHHPCLKCADIARCQVLQPMDLERPGCM